jgi:outer membrane protein OmpA-like peptidoglycan-associated protein
MNKLWAPLGVLILLGIGVYFWATSNQNSVGPPVTQAPPAADKAAADKAASDKAAADKAAADKAASDKAAADATDKAAADKAAADKVADAATGSNTKATAELAALKSGFSATDLITALNDSVVNFASGSVEIPASIGPFLRSAAEDLKQLPKGHVLEIAGYTDNTGNAQENVALSQRRADAVREALINEGADPDMLIAKGYGSADPIASNDTPEGRFRNRRIEYHVVKTP